MQSDENIFSNVKSTQLPDFRNWVLDILQQGFQNKGIDI